MFGLKFKNAPMLIGQEYLMRCTKKMNTLDILELPENYVGDLKSDSETGAIMRKKRVWLGAPDKPILVFADWKGKERAGLYHYTNFFHVPFKSMTQAPPQTPPVQPPNRRPPTTIPDMRPPPPPPPPPPPRRR